MVIWRGLAFAGLVSSAAILAAGAAPAGAGSQPPAATIRLAQNEAPAADAGATEAPAAQAPAAGGDPAGDAAATEEAAPDDAAAAESATGDAAAEEEKEVAVFTEEFLNDPAHQQSGKVVWAVCAGCHGAQAYPGKAPKLRPKRYTPEFVFDRVTHGYKKMPAWKDVFSKEERMDVVAYILSEDFTP